MMIATILAFALWLIAFSAAAPAKIGYTVDDISNAGLIILDQLCSYKACLFGAAAFHPSSLSCSCPEWPEDLYTGPCGGLQCEHDTEAFYSVIDDVCYCGTMEAWRELEAEVLNAGSATSKAHPLELQLRQAVTPSATPDMSAANLTFIPPPK